MLGVLGRAGTPLAPERCFELSRRSPLLPVLRGGNLGRAQEAPAPPCQDRGLTLEHLSSLPPSSPLPAPVPWPLYSGEGWKGAIPGGHRMDAGLSEGSGGRDTSLLGR